MRRRQILLCAVATSAMVLPVVIGSEAASATSAAPKPQVVVHGLNNPRQLALDGNVLLVAEAGKGGNLKVLNDPEGGSQGVGRTGSVTAVAYPAYAKNVSPQRILTGLLSAASPDGSGAVGSDGVAAWGRSIFVQETFFPPQALPSAKDAKRSGKLLAARPYSDDFRTVADISGWEASRNPDHQAIDSDPYAVLRVHDYLLVADAAGNDVLKVDDEGDISTFHVFGNIVNATCLDPSLQQPPPDKPGCQFVPTSLATDRQGNVYVGGLGGLVPGQGRVVKLSADGKHVLKTWTGLTSVTGVAVNSDGDVYASQLFAPEAHPANPAIQGVLTKISRSGNRSNIDVPFPAGVVTDNRGNVYVSAFSIAPAGGLSDPGSGQHVPGTSGQVWRLHW